MFCYLDKTFCTVSQADCGNIECHRYFTEALRESANEWMENPPIAYSDFSGTCGQYQKLIDVQPVRETFGIKGHHRSAQILTIEAII